MNSLYKLSVAALLLVGGTAFVTTAIVRAQDKPADGGGMPMDPAMMTRMMELATPGKEHAELAKSVGAWEQHYKFRWSPDAPWMETTGTSEAKALLGGRYILEEIKFEMMGMPLEAVHLIGFDKNKGEYTTLWADSMSTWWITARGPAKADGTLEVKGTMVDVAGERPFRMVSKPQADGSVFVEMYDTIPPTGEVKVMEITSKKKG
jgi:hypothetical protein